MTKPEPSNPKFTFLAMLFFPGVAAAAAVVPMWREDVRLVILTLALFGVVIFLALRWEWLIALLKDGRSSGRRALAWLAVVLGIFALIGALHWGSRVADRKGAGGGGQTEDNTSANVADDRSKVEGNLSDEGNLGDAGNVADQGNLADTGEVANAAADSPRKIVVPPEVVETPPSPPREPSLTCADLREARKAFEDKAWAVAGTCMVRMSVKAKPLSCREKDGAVALDTTFSVTGQFRGDKSEFKLCYNRRGPFEPAAIGSRLISGNYRQVCREKMIDPSVLESDCP